MIWWIGGGIVVVFLLFVVIGAISSKKESERYKGSTSRVEKSDEQKRAEFEAYARKQTRQYENDNL